MEEAKGKKDDIICKIKEKKFKAEIYTFKNASISQVFNMYL